MFECDLGGTMKFDRQRYFAASMLFALMLVVAGDVAAKKRKSLTATANGKGTLRVGKEAFDVHAVVIKLFEDGKAEITLVSDITVFVNGTWARAAEQNVINLEIT